MKKGKALLILMVMLAMLAGAMGFAFGKSAPEVRYIEVLKPEYVWLPSFPNKGETEYIISPPTFITKIETVERIVEKVVTVNQTVIVAQNITKLLTDWESFDELKQFLASDNTSEMVILKNKSSLTGSIDSSGIYAVSLRVNANRIGRYLDAIEIYGTEYGWWYGKVVGAGVTHGANRAKVWMGEYWAVYYIDPQTDRLWWVFNT